MKHLNIRKSNIIKRYARRRESLPDGTVKINPPKSLPNPPGKPNLLMMLPTLAMALSVGAISYFFSAGSSGSARALITAVPMTLMAIMMISVQMYGHRSQVKQYEARVTRINRNYDEHLARKQNTLEKYANEQRRIIQQENPSFRELERRVVSRAPTLWERQPFDNDFAAVRLGLGRKPLCVDIKLPEPDDEDERLGLAFAVAAEFRHVDHVPIIANLNRLGTVGIQGTGHSNSLYMAFNIISNLVVHHSPDELQIYLISHRADAKERWSWLRWVPHTGAITRREQAQISLHPGADEPILFSLSQLLRHRMDRQRSSRQSLGRNDPHVVVIFDRAPDLQGHAVIDMLIQQKPDQENGRLHATALFIESPIPPQINALVTVTNKQLEYRETWMADANQVHYQGTADLITASQMERLARLLAPLRTEVGAGSSGKLPSSVRLVELLGAEQPHELNFDELYSDVYDPERVMSFPIGLNIDLRPLMIILRETGQGGYGSHAMLAGMTGTGKSVLLQALVLSMALTNSPAHLNFVLADFKGGASELAKLQGLPHLAGFVTDLNPALVERFRIALESEVLRRKTLFDNADETLGHNIANIRTYNRLCPHNPLPHLVVVLDEFAHGLRINPNFQKAIDTIAAQGRALGVHLVLSTQRPADFDDKIRPNIDVRLSLRVARKEDSKIMFQREEAFTELRRPGQAYLQVGDNEIFEVFQAARADLPHMPEGTVSLEQVDSIDDFSIFSIGPDGRGTLLYEHSTDKNKQKIGDLIESEAEALVSQVRAYASERYRPVQQIALPPLPHTEALPLLSLISDKPVFRRWHGAGWENDETRSEQRLRAALGLLDLPAERAQRTFYVDLNQRDGNFMVIGPAGAGVSLFLRSLILGFAATHAPADVQFYILARGLALTLYEELPHCGALIHSKETERIDRLFNFLEREIEHRRRLMAQHRADSMHTLRTTDTGHQLPALVVIFEEFTAFHAEHEDRLSQVQRLTGDGQGVDIHFILAASSITNIRTGVRENFRNRLSLGLNSVGDYRNVFDENVPVLEEILGRGYTNPTQDVLECQIAAPAAQPGIDARSHSATDNLRAIVQGMAQAWSGARPATIEALPFKLELEQLWKRLSFDARTNGRWQTAPLGLEFDNLEPVIINFNRYEPYSLVIGPQQSGKTTFLATLVLTTIATIPPEKLRILVLTSHNSPLQTLNQFPHVETAGTRTEVQKALTELVSQLERRTTEINEAQENESRPDNLSVPPRTLVLVDDLQSVMRAVPDFPNLIDQCAKVGQTTGIYFVFSETANAFKALKNQNYSFQTLQSACSFGCGISFSLEQQALSLLSLQLPNATVQAHATTMGKGRALLSYQNRATVVQVARAIKSTTSPSGAGQHAEMNAVIERLTAKRQGVDHAPE